MVLTKLTFMTINIIGIDTIYHAVTVLKFLLLSYIHYETEHLTSCTLVN